jgi:hypothetical protein
MLDSMHRARLGRRRRVNLYAQLGTWPDDTDPLLALFNNQQLAQTAEDALNGRAVRGVPWIAVGRLIYPMVNPIIPGEFIGVAVSDEVAERIASAVSQ